MLSCEHHLRISSWLRTAQSLHHGRRSNLSETNFDDFRLSAREFFIRGVSTPAPKFLSKLPAPAPWFEKAVDRDDHPCKNLRVQWQSSELEEDRADSAHSDEKFGVQIVKDSKNQLFHGFSADSIGPETVILARNWSDFCHNPAKWNPAALVPSNAAGYSALQWTTFFVTC